MPKSNNDEPQPLNFDHDDLTTPYPTPEDTRGDAEDDQYYEEEEAMSPEEVEQRKKEGTM